MKKIINPFIHFDGYNCFGCAPQNPLGLKLTFYEDGDDIVATWQPRPEFQGWLNTLHGGVQATLIDEICGWVIMRKLQTTGVTSQLNMRYLRPVSCLEGALTLRAHITAQRRNLVDLEATLTNAQGKVCAQGTCTYFTFPPEKAREQWHFTHCPTEDEL